VSPAIARSSILTFNGGNLHYPERTRWLKGNKEMEKLVLWSMTGLLIAVVLSWLALCEVGNWRMRNIDEQLNATADEIDSLLAAVGQTPPSDPVDAFRFALERPDVLLDANSDLPRLAARISELEANLSVEASRLDRLKALRQYRPQSTGHANASLATVPAVLKSATIALPQFCAEATPEAYVVLFSRVYERDNAVKGISIKAVAECAQELGTFSADTIKLSDALRGTQEVILRSEASDITIQLKVIESYGRRSLQTGKELACVCKDAVKIVGEEKAAILTSVSQVSGGNAIPQPDASVEQMAPTVERWNTAVHSIHDSMIRLQGERWWMQKPSDRVLAKRSLPSYATPHQTKLLEEVLYTESLPLEKPARLIRDNLVKIGALYEQAMEEESKPFGSLARAFRRGTRKAGESRIGQELQFTFKNLVLGAKVYFEIMDAHTPGEIMSIAEQHEGDMENLQQNFEEIQGMDGWSLTGKNTPLERVVNKLYEQQFQEQ